MTKPLLPPGAHCSGGPEGGIMSLTNPVGRGTSTAYGSSERSPTMTDNERKETPNDR